MHQTLTSPKSRSKPTVEAHLDLIEPEARAMLRGLPDRVELDDLCQEGFFGLAEAVDHFDPARGVEFRTYARRLIRGRMADFLRGEDTIPRIARIRHREAESAREALRHRLGREPSEGELVDELAARRDAAGPRGENARITLGDPARTHAEAAAVPSLTSLSLSRARTRDERPLDSTPAHAIAAPAAAVDRAAIAAEQAAEIMAGLSRAERLAVRLAFLEGFTLLETAGVIGLSEARLSQILNNVIPRLQANPRLRALAERDAAAAGRAVAPDSRGSLTRMIRAAIHGAKPIHRKPWSERKRRSALAGQGGRRTDAAQGAQRGQAAPPPPAQDGPAEASNPNLKLIPRKESLERLAI